MKRLVFFGIWLLGCLWSQAMATTMIAMDVAQLTKSSDVILRGSVVGVSSRWTMDKMRIMTDVEMDVSLVLKGENVPSRVTVMFPGGIVGDVGQRVEGVPSFVVGEDAMLFLERRGDSHFIVVGMAQGKFTLQKGKDGKPQWALPDEAGHSLLLDENTRKPVAQRTVPLKYEELLAQITKALGKKVPSEPATKVPKVTP